MSAFNYYKSCKFKSKWWRPLAHSRLARPNTTSYFSKFLNLKKRYFGVSFFLPFWRVPTYLHLSLLASDHSISPKFTWNSQFFSEQDVLTVRYCTTDSLDPTCGWRGWLTTCRCSKTTCSLPLRTVFFSFPTMWRWEQTDSHRIVAISRPINVEKYFKVAETDIFRPRDTSFYCFFSVRFQFCLCACGMGEWLAAWDREFWLDRKYIICKNPLKQSTYFQFPFYQFYLFHTAKWSKKKTKIFQTSSMKMITN
jgi:hypothetical protein